MIYGRDEELMPPSPEIASRFEAIVIACDDAPPAASARPAAERLLDAGVLLAVVTRADMKDWEELAHSTRHRGSLLVARAPIEDVIDELWRRGIAPGEIALLGALTGPAPEGVVCLDGNAAGTLRVLERQLELRQEKTLPPDAAPATWRLVLEEIDDGRERVRDALVALVDGRVGIVGTLVGIDATSPRWMAAAGVYDGDGPDTHLLTGPVLAPIRAGVEDRARLRRVLDLHTGLLHETLELDSREQISCTRFVAKARPGTGAARLSYPTALAVEPARLAPTLVEPHDEGTTFDGAWMRVAATAGGIAMATASDRAVPDVANTVLDLFACYAADPERLPDADAALAGARAAKAAGFDQLLAEQRELWARRWDDADIVIEGDDELQVATRWSLFQLMASIGDGPEAAVGARGLGGPGYRGHVFWDADLFVLPFLAATHPASARAMLEYRIRRLPAAREAARARSRRGARFPWESARTGFDVTPLSARDRSGRVVPIRTGQLEEHIVADVAWAASCYVDWTGDDAFAEGPGLSILVDTARYWASRARTEADGAHIYGVIGPDEYHEPVDDNAYTNVMARWNLRRAADAVSTATSAHHGVEPDELGAWRDLADALVDGYDPDTGIYEQFAGFARLEPLIIEEVAPRRPIAADLWLGSERVRRTQVIKQADVLMLYHLVPDEVVPGTLEANLRYYEPRSAHGSSLSPAIHAAVLARARDFPRALAALRIASRIDLDDLTGTTAAGMHVATMGGLWQALVFGFAGIRPRAGRLAVDPHLPPDWGALAVRVRYRGSRVQIRAEHGYLTVSADPPAALMIGGTPFDVTAAGLQFRRRGPAWEVTT